MASPFAPTSAEVAKVTAWLKSSGFRVTAVPANHRYVEVTATAATTEKALATSLGSFVKDGANATAPDRGVLRA